MNYYNSTYVDFSVLEGKVISKISVIRDTDDGDELNFYMSSGEHYKMYHSQDCCECVGIEDIEGNVEDIVNAVVSSAYESSDSTDTDYGSETWTFYRLNTDKGGLVIRWFGSSNGYYSESVSFVKMSEE